MAAFSVFRFAVLLRDAREGAIIGMIKRHAGADMARGVSLARGWVVLLLFAVPVLAQGQEAAMTRSGHEMAVSMSGYSFDEPSVMTIKATKIAVDYSGTHAFRPDWPHRSEGWYVRGDLRFAGGKADYDSSLSGTIHDHPDWYIETRGLVGKDFVVGEAVLSPYVGIGYRYLFNDLRGTSSTGALGYRRESHYYSLPLGVTHRVRLSSGTELSTLVEYAPLLRGRQESMLTDANAALPNVSNLQRRGYGLRLGATLRMGRWSVGPLLSWWRIENSDSVTTATGAVFTEPRNQTREVGLRVGYHF